MRYFLHIGYKGTKYRGWQRQPKVMSVQEVLESKIAAMLKRECIIFGCGRTDAGVHASQYFAHLDIPEQLDFDFVFRLNKMLPNDVVLFEMIPVEQGQHARYDATARSYDYFIHRSPHPFLDEFSSLYEIDHLDLTVMQKACTLLPQYEDYRALCKAPDKHNHTRCNIMKTQLYVNDSEERLRFHITANRFLKGMIRILVNRLLELGTGKISLDYFEHLLKTQQANEVVKLAYPQGLFLSKIVYPYLDIPNKMKYDF